MKFELAFLEEAQKEWRKLDATIWAQLNERLSERLEHPPVPASKLCCHPDRYKIKLPSVGGRLVCEVRDKQVLVLVVAVGKSERNEVYKAAAKR